MSWIEVALVMVGKVSGAAAFFAILGLIAIVCLAAVLVIGKAVVAGNKKDSWQSEEGASLIAGGSAGLKICIPLVAVLALLGSLPSVDDLWKVRIGLIKLSLASPENIQKGAEVIERIGKKLECKYVGCDEPKAVDRKDKDNAQN